MRSLATLTALLISTTALGGCGMIHAAQQSAADSFHKSFRTSFKTGFMKSCVNGGATDKLCSCIEATLEKNNTDEQLMKLSSDEDATRHQLDAAGEACKARAGAT
jgi:hypothetical protein